jgi:hypothetical protein
LSLAAMGKQLMATNRKNTICFLIAVLPEIVD